MIIDAFKIPVYATALDLDTKEITDYCIKHREKDKGRNISNVGGWQSKDLEGVHMPINELFKEIVNHLNLFGKELQVNSKLNIENIWMNINGYKDFNVDHTHPHSLISGVFYSKTPENCGEIEFMHPCTWFDYDWMQEYFSKHNVYNSLRYKIKPEPNLLLLFPNYLTHKVLPNLNKTEERVSLSFNSRYV